eukprot:751727-Hanusia_phi.AAC.9
MSAEPGRADLQEVADTFDAEIVEYYEDAMSAEVCSSLPCVFSPPLHPGQARADEFAPIHSLQRVSGAGSHAVRPNSACHWGKQQIMRGYCDRDTGGNPELLLDDGRRSSADGEGEQGGGGG